MGSMEVPSQGSDTIKVPASHYEFGANFLDPKVLIVFFISQCLIDGYLHEIYIVDACWEDTD